MFNVGMPDMDDQTVEMLRDLWRVMTYGCGDGNCRIKRPQGIHTNGGCKCIREMPEQLLEIAARIEPIRDHVTLRIPDLTDGMYASGSGGR